MEFAIIVSLMLWNQGLFRNRVMVQAQQYSRVRRRMRVDYERARSRRYRRHRSLMMQLAIQYSVAAAIAGCHIDRTVWRRAKLHARVSWESLLRFDTRYFRENLRMSKAGFERLASELRPMLEKQVTNFEVPIDYRVRLAAVLWWLATPGEYRSVCQLFGIGISTMCKLTRQVCSAIHESLFNRYISLPSGDRLDETVAGFRRRGFPQCCGAIDGTHLPVLTPKENPADYHNRKGWHSIVLQAVVDHNYRFTDVYIGWPGRAHDARILSYSDLFVKAEHRQDGYLFPRNKSMVINGTEIPVFIIGDPAYPLRKWLMKGYPAGPNQTADQARFNHRLSSARMVVENAFGRLKGRWRRLLKRNDVETSFASDVIATCCILHNFCEVHGEAYDMQWERQRIADEAAQGLVQPEPRENDQRDNVTAAQIRDTVMGIL